MDFRVYYFGAGGVFDGTRPVYGQTSGLGWPMHYRYPPLFLLLAYPLTLLPLTWAAGLWAIAKVAALSLVVAALWNRLGPAISARAWWIPLLLAGPYVFEDLRYGNAQSFVFALTAAALLLLPRSALAAGAILGFAAILKVWPLYFVPYLAARREWKPAGWAIAFTILFALLPGLYFGFQGNTDLLAQWTAQELSTQTSQSEIWFPSQSLRGVMMRYLTVLDYSQMPDSNYRLVHVAALDPAVVRALWAVLAACAYFAVLAITSLYHRKVPFGVTEALAFATLVLLQPFSQKYTLVVLLWPAIVAGRLAERSRWNVLLYGATALALFQPIVQGAAAQRLLQVLGMDFATTALLTLFLLASILFSAGISKG
jgi:hypothetical protein